MNKEHIKNLSDIEIAKGLKPLASHEFWAYFEEHLRREQLKQVRQLASLNDHAELHRAQGRFDAYQRLADLGEQIRKM